MSRFQRYIAESLKIYLDDERPAPPGYILVRTPKEAIRHLKKGKVDTISLDHDLGDDKNIGTGYDVLLWIEKQVHTNPKYRPPKSIKIHTANPSARKKMELALRSITSVMNEESISIKNFLKGNSWLPSIKYKKWKAVRDRKTGNYRVWENNKEVKWRKFPGPESVLSYIQTQEAMEAF